MCCVCPLYSELRMKYFDCHFLPTYKFVNVMRSKSDEILTNIACSDQGETQNTRSWRYMIYYFLKSTWLSYRYFITINLISVTYHIYTKISAC